MASRDQVVQQIADATRGVEALLNNDLAGAKKLLGARQDPFHVLGLGITAFLAATLSREDEELKQATELLIKAETLASNEATGKRAPGEVQIYPPGTEYKLLTGDATIGQALTAILSESYAKFVGALWKMNKSYKIFQASFKTVFPEGVGEDESLDSIVSKLNAHYHQQTTNPSLAVPESSGGFFSSWGRRKGAAASPALRHAASSTTLSSTAPLVSSTSHPSASEPPTALPSADPSMDDLSKNVKAKVSLVENKEHPEMLWKDDTITSLIISGTAFGCGMFGLIFSSLPPKMRKVISWVGFTNSSRPIALKLLTVSASCDDIHGCFASLTLITFYCFILLMSGWQAREEYLINQVHTILERVYNRFPDGTLWRLNKAKIARMRRNADAAIEILESTLAKGSSFREADSLLVFELSWLYLSQARYLDCAASFEKMNEMNSWSPSTYIAGAAGALVDAYNSSSAEERTPELVERLNKHFEHLPTLFSMKRVFGEPPVTEMFIKRRYEAHQAKLKRWIAAGRVKPDAKVWEVIRISNAFELGLFWNSIGGRSPESGLRKQIELLSSFSPAPRFSPSTSSAKSPKPSFTNLSPTATSTSSLSKRRGSATPASAAGGSRYTADDLDNSDELAIRDLLLGALYSALGDSASLATAQQYLAAVLQDAAAGAVQEELWVVPFARFNLAAAICREGDVEERELAAGKDVERRKMWKPRLEKADELLDAVFNLGEYDLKTRLESRVLMLKDELAQKRKLIGL
ncbi:hypothetical protein JCM8097_003120 [Rhodosporidiobolus ruineniae]